MGYDTGVKAENFFASLLNGSGLEYRFDDLWYDFLVNKKIKVEVKCTTISLDQGNGKEFKIGRFDFTAEENRVRQLSENVWICFILRWRDQYMLLGFAKAEHFKAKRYVSLHDLRRIGMALLDYHKWIKKVNR